MDGFIEMGAHNIIYGRIVSSTELPGMFEVSELVLDLGPDGKVDGERYESRGFYGPLAIRRALPMRDDELRTWAKKVNRPLSPVETGTYPVAEESLGGGEDCDITIEEDVPF